MPARERGLPRAAEGMRHARARRGSGSSEGGGVHHDTNPPFPALRAHGRPLPPSQRGAPRLSRGAPAWGPRHSPATLRHGGCPVTRHHARPSPPQARFFVLQCYLGRPAAHRQAFLHAVDGADSPVTPPRLCCHRCRRILARSSSVLFLCNLAAEGAGPVRCQHAPSAAGCGAGSGRGAAVQPPSSALVEPLCWMAPPPGAPSDAGGAPPSADPLAPAAPEAVRDRVQGPAAEKLRCPHCGAKVGVFARVARSVLSAAPAALREPLTNPSLVTVLAPMVAVARPTFLIHRIYEEGEATCAVSPAFWLPPTTC